jgi:hypothetical protein
VVIAIILSFISFLCEFQGKIYRRKASTRTRSLGHFGQTVRRMFGVMVAYMPHHLRCMVCDQGLPNVMGTWGNQFRVSIYLIYLVIKNEIRKREREREYLGT